MKTKRPDPLLALTVLFAVFVAGFFLGRNYRQEDVLLSSPGPQPETFYLPKAEDTTLPPPTERININTADAKALEALPGIGPAIAGRIIAYREENGPFPSPAALIRVDGVGEALLTEIYDLITVQEDAP